MYLCSIVVFTKYTVDLHEYYYIEQRYIYSDTVHLSVTCFRLSLIMLLLWDKLSKKQFLNVINCTQIARQIA